APEGLTIHSKPGLFGWNKIDQGSEFLIQSLPAMLGTMPRPPASLLDLGCGYGYLTLMTKDLPLQGRVLTDNNAAALFTARHNCDRALCVWNKRDQGCGFLFRSLPAMLGPMPRPPASLLDLGCGYGYLTLMTKDLPLQGRVLTDNNAAALFTARHNCELNNI